MTGETSGSPAAQRLYHLPAAGGKPTPRGTPFDAPPTALAPLSAGRLAVAVDTRVLVLARADGKVVQVLELPEPGTCLAADPTGQWLAVGTCERNGGRLRVRDGRPNFA